MSGAVQFECAYGAVQLSRRTSSSYPSDAIMRDKSIAIMRNELQIRSAAKRYATCHINNSARARGNNNGDC